jgi:hypothetical protein
MAGPRSGLNAQLGFAEETTWGTGVTPTLFVPLVNESINQQIDRLESKAIIAGARAIRSQQWTPGNQYVKGSVGLELNDRTTSMLFKHMFGTVVTSGAGPYTHTFTPGDLKNLGLTLQIGRPDNSGTVQPFTYAGTKIGKWQLGLKADEIATLGLDIVAKSETTATALASASYAASISPLSFVGASLNIAGSAYKVNNVTLSGDNKLDDKRIFIGQTTVDEPLEVDLREYVGTIDSEFVDLTAYNRFVAGTEAALVLSLAKGTSTVTITCNVRFDGNTPNVAGGAILRQPLPYKCVGATTDASAITAVLVNSDVTP